MTDFWKSAAFTALGAVCSTIGFIATGYFQQSHEDDRHFKELAYKSAFEEWKTLNIKENTCTLRLDELVLSHLLIASIVKTYKMDMSDKKRKEHLMKIVSDAQRRRGTQIKTCP